MNLSGRSDILNTRDVFIENVYRSIGISVAVACTGSVKHLTYTRNYIIDIYRLKMYQEFYA